MLVFLEKRGGAASLQIVSGWRSETANLPGSRGAVVCALGLFQHSSTVFVEAWAIFDFVAWDDELVRLVSALDQLLGFDFHLGLRRISKLFIERLISFRFAVVRLLSFLFENDVVCILVDIFNAPVLIASS